MVYKRVLALTVSSLALFCCAAAKPAPSTPVSGPPRFDLVGDPMPKGAVAQLTTTRIWLDASIRNFAISPDGKILASGHDENIRLWDFQTGKQLAVLKPLSRHAEVLAFSRDNKGLLSASQNEQPRLWDVASGQLMWLFGNSKSKERFEPCAFSADGAVIAKTDHRGKVLLVDLATDKRLLTMEGHTKDCVIKAAFSPDGKLVATSDGVLRVWSVRTGKALSLYKATSTIVSVAFSPDGRTVAVGGADGVVRLIEAATGRERLVFRGHLAIYDNHENENPNMPVAISPDGKIVASGYMPGIVMLWDAATGDVIQILGNISDRVAALAFAPDGKTLVGAGYNERLVMWAVPQGRGTSAVGRNLVFSPDGKTVAAGCVDGHVRIWEANTGKILQTFEGHTRQANAVALSPDGKMLASAGLDHTVRVWDVPTGKQHVNLAAKQLVNSIAFAPDGKTVAMASQDEVRLYDTPAFKEPRLILSDGKPFRCVVFSPDGKMLATSAGDDDRTFQLWDAATLKEIHRWQSKTKTLDWLAFSPDSQTLIAADRENAIRRWHTGTGKELPTLPNLAGKGVGVALSPDGKTLATTGPSLQLWDLATGKSLRSFSGQSLVMSAAFSPDGKRLATSGLDSEILVWDASR